MTDREYFIEFWTPTVGAEEAARSWEAKQHMERNRPQTPYVRGDIAPYKSMIDGSMITSRSQHRTHLKDHGMVEVGNEKMPAKKREIPDVGGLREELYARVSG